MSFSEITLRVLVSVLLYPGSTFFDIDGLAGGRAAAQICGPR